MGVFSRAVRALTSITQNIFTSPHQNWMDNNGVPLANGRLYAYAAGTQTPVNTWQDSALTIVNTNPVILDAGGFTTVWLDPNSVYKFRMVNSLGQQQWTVDNYQAGSLTANILVPLNFIIPAFATNTIDNGNFTQDWTWGLTGSGEETGMGFGEIGPSTNTNPNTAIVTIWTLPGSTVWPLRVGAQFPRTGAIGQGGFGVTPTGNIQALGSAIFIGPVQIPSLINQPVLGTDALGNIIPGVGGGGPGIAGLISINADATPAQQIVAGPGINVSTAIGTGITTISLGAGLASLAMAPASVLGPASSTGTVTLSSQALAGGVTVTLSSNNANVTVPASVFIAAGGTTATFTATTLAVTANVTATITASYSGATRTANLTVTAPVVAQPIYGGVGNSPGATTGTLLGTTVTLDTGDTLAQLQTTAEAVGNQWNFSPNNQYIYLLMTKEFNTFLDQNGQPFAFSGSFPLNLGGRSMWLYQSVFTLLGTFTVRVNTAA